MKAESRDREAVSRKERAEPGGLGQAKVSL